LAAMVRLYEIMELWNYGIMELWNYGIMELWNYGIMELWNYGIMELWNYGLHLVKFAQTQHIFSFEDLFFHLKR
jgi:hypothetical protein